MALRLAGWVAAVLDVRQPVACGKEKMERAEPRARRLIIVGGLFEGTLKAAALTGPVQPGAVGGPGIEAAVGCGHRARELGRHAPHRLLHVGKTRELTA